MTLLGREVAEVEALVTDRYLDSLLAAAELPSLTDGTRRRDALGVGLPPLDEAVRLASRRLTRDLPRFHPSFRFEERLAVRLAESAAAMRMPAAAGAEGLRLTSTPAPTAFPRAGGRIDAAFDPLADPLPDGDELVDRGILLRGAMAASALSLAGAAFVAWRRNRGGAMARAVRAAHALRERPV